MLRLKIFLVLITTSLLATNILAQQSSVEQMMSDSQTRNQVMDYMISHQSIMNEFMNKMIDNKGVLNFMMGYLISMMNHMFSKAYSDEKFYNEMQRYMNNHSDLMNMMNGMMDGNMYSGLMNHSNMMHNNAK